MRALWLTLRETAKLAGSQRRLWVPFLLTVSIELCFIGLIWLAPHPPYSALLAPPVRFLFGERVLHYPWHLWFLYHAMRHTHVAASAAAGAFLTGVACAMVEQAHLGAPMSIRGALLGGRLRYGHLVLAWLAAWLLMEGLRGALVRAAMPAPVLLAASIALQLALVYAIPAVVFERASWWRALWLSLREMLRAPLATLLVASGPLALVIGFSLTVSSIQVAHWMERTAPEIALAFVAARLVIWTLADALLTVAIAHLWWARRHPAAPAERAGVSCPLVAMEGPAVA